MFACLDCGAVFDEPATHYENHGEYFGRPAQEAFGACPCCGSTDYDEARRCDRCGEWTTEWTWDGALYYCPECYDELYG